MLETVQVLISLQLGLIAFMVSCVFTKQGYILSKYYDCLVWLGDTKGQKWLSYPLGYCEKCLAGQFALWFWFAEYNIYTVEKWYIAFFNHMSFISLTILATMALKGIFKRWI